jgi:O-antigen ligase
MTQIIPLFSRSTTISQNYIEANDPLQQLVASTIYAISLFLLLLSPGQVVKRLITKDQLIWVVLLIVAASILWSDFPEITMRRVVALIGNTFFGLYFATHYDFKRQLNILAWAYGIVALLSIAVALGLPRYGIMNFKDVSGWRGIFLHKNGLGSGMTLSALLFMLLFLDGGYKWVKGAFFVISIALLVLSKSQTALLSFVIILGLMPFYRALRWRSEVAIPFFIIAFLTFAGTSLWLSDNFSTVAESVGRDPTLTGRTPVWSAVWDMILRRPWLGYGYEGFWQSSGSGAAYVWNSVRFKVAHSHNSFLELMLTIGIIGTFVYYLQFFCLFFKSLNLIRMTNSFSYLWPALFLSQLLFNSFTEKVFLPYNSLSWAIYISFVFLNIELSRNRQSSV